MMEKLLKIAEKYCSEEQALDEDTSIMMDMELTSLEFFHFICDVEEQFGIHFTERELRRIDSLGDLNEVICSK